MELKVYKDSVTSSEIVCDTKQELPIETEILIPDYLPQVFKIVKCFARLVVLQKQMTASRITIEGYIRCVVYYQSDAGQSLCQIEQKVPFTKQAELKDGDYHGMDAFVTGETEYINCRAVNQRRVDIRGAFALGIKVSARSEQEIITALAENGMEQKQISLIGMRVVGTQEKMITAEDAIVFDGAPLAVIDTAMRFNINDTKLMNGKVICKGELIAEVTYRISEGSSLLKTTKVVPFNEILDIEGAAEDCTAFVIAEPTGCTILSGGEGSDTNISITALLIARVLKPCEYLAVGDAFSTKYQTTLEKNNVNMEKTEDIFTQQMQIIVEGTLPDENAQLVDVRASTFPVEAIEENGEIVLRSRVAAHMVCINALGELDCYDKTAEFTLPKRYANKIENINIVCVSGVNSVVARKVGEQAQATINLTVYGLVTSKIKFQVVSRVQCDELLLRPDDDIALRIYYAQVGEDVFDIAKRYLASPSAIASANNIEQGELNAASRLLIPSAI